MVQSDRAGWFGAGKHDLLWILASHLLVSIDLIDVPDGATSFHPAPCSLVQGFPLLENYIRLYSGLTLDEESHTPAPLHTYDQLSEYKLVHALSPYYQTIKTAWSIVSGTCIGT